MREKSVSVALLASLLFADDGEPSVSRLSVS